MAAEDLEWERSKISNQDMNLLKKLGFTKKENTLRFPSEESYPSPPMKYRVSFVDHMIRGLSPPIHEFLRGLLFVYGLQLQQLTPNSILHVSIFITLCVLLGVHPNWALWKRIFCIRRNGAHGVAYNIGGVVICVRPDVEYFDVKFPDSIQGWRKRWLYIHEESSDSVEYNIAPFDGKTKILRRRSWDAEATEEEKSAIEALMTRIRELQNTRGKELSGIQITAYFLRIRVQPLQARKNPLWMYAGDEDVERISKDLPVKDLEKLIRRMSKLSKKDIIPTSCRVAPYSSTNPLPENHPSLTSLPPLPEGGEVEDRTVVDDDNQGTSRPDSEVAGSHRSAASSEKDAESEATASTHSPPPASPKNKRKRNESKDSGTSKAEEVDPSDGKATFNPYTDALVSSGDEEEEQPIDVAARTNTSRTLVVSEAQHDGDETSPPQQNVEHSTHPASPRAPSPKRARVEPSKEPIMFPGSSSTPSLDDLFPYFFPKKEEPNTFVALAKAFNVPEDLGLKLRQEGLKIGVEGTIALIANSQQYVDWTKVGDIGEMETKKWQSLIRTAKPPSKPILSFLGVKPTPAPSASKPEVK
ncbi:hypothetical protein QYE76_034677 [Lolium multiflorum]|uniref:Transposase (putative) gypsy type domain-containing protein n=1 Tax=Lolium multiflorum TaxID=4521 RepID=A0AAD8R028_LOLMU|nr:hypothetical protein QYE76_034677 [Lolium multiflorum]